MDAIRIAALLADTLILYIYIDVLCWCSFSTSTATIFCVAVKRIRKDLPVEAKYLVE